MVDLFFEWYLREVPISIKKIWGNYLWFFSKYFALAELLGDFFGPFKGMAFKREKRAFEIGDVFSAWFGNVILRILGAILRSFIIIIGGTVELVTILAGIIAYFVWAALLILAVASFCYGIWLLIDVSV